MVPGARVDASLITLQDVFFVIQICLFSVIWVKADLQYCAIIQAAHQQLITKPATASHFSTLVLYHRAGVAADYFVAVI